MKWLAFDTDIYRHALPTFLAKRIKDTNLAQRLGQPRSITTCNLITNLNSINDKSQRQHETSLTDLYEKV